MVEFVYNSAKHSTLGISPYKALYRFQPYRPLDTNVTL